MTFFACGFFTVYRKCFVCIYLYFKDVEEIVWDIACLARLDPASFPPTTMLSLPKGQKDRRKIMGTVYSLFRGETTEEALIIAGQPGK